MLASVGVDSLAELIDRTVPAAIRTARPLALPRARSEAEALAALRGMAQHNRLATSHDRHGLLRHPHAAGDPAQRAGEPRLVHGLHALPGRGQPGPARGRAQLPADGGRPHRHGAGQRLAARRGHGRRRGDGDGAPGPPQQVRPLLRRPWLPSADPGRAAHPRPPSGHRAGAGRRRRRSGGRGRVRRTAPVSRHQRPHPRPARRDRGRPAAGRPGRGRHRPPGAGPADAPGRAGCGHRPGLGPALRRAHGLWRPARRLLRHQGRPQARHARPDHRRLARRPRQARPAHGAADPRAAHPPRQGHQQHLHRPGPAGGHGRLLRRLARARGPDADRAARARPHRPAGDSPAGDRHRGRQRRPSSTRSPSRSPAAPTTCSSPPATPA